MTSLDLGGTWRARWSDGVRGRPEAAEAATADEARYIDAQVPGEIHLDCLRAGLISDPGYGTQVLAARWVEEMLWSYRREFEAPPAARRTRAWIVFERLDLAARVVLNGEEIGRHANAFYPCRIEVTGRLRRGRNRLAVHIEGGLYHAADRPAGGYNRSIDHLLTRRHWLRKPQCQFGWDWAPRLVNVGITGPARLEWTAAPARVEAFVPLAEVSPDLRTGRVRGRIFVEGLRPDPVPGRLTLSLPGTGGSVSTTLEIRPGLHRYEAALEVRAPRLWWPAGHGAPSLYEVRAELAAGGRTVDRRTARIGFRHIEINQKPHPDGGRYFHFVVNGRPVFCKGANWVPADMIFARCDRKRYDRLTALAREANFNLLRVWGGGLYESDDFYDLCDRRGLLVWQEFVFACSKYPAHDETFLDSVKAEAAYNVRRLAPHPSLVAWCGNNEIEQGHWHWGYDRGVANPDHALYHVTLPRIVEDEDGTRYYQPSSPYSPEGLDPLRDDVGDQHPWSVGFANCDFRDYRRMTCRFPNEGGFLGPPSLPTLRSCLPEGERRAGSFAWQVHDNAVDTWAEPSYADRILSFWLGLDIRKLSLEDLAYYGGLLQGEALQAYCDNFRRRMFSSGAAIFWMFNDCWPTVRSWTIVDHSLRRTPSFHPVRRALAPVRVVVAEEGTDIVVFGVNDLRRAFRGRLRFGVFRLDGGYPLDRSAEVALAPNASTPLARFPASQWRDSRSTMAFAVLMRDGAVVTRNRLFRPTFREMRWPAAKVRVRRAGDRAVFESPTYAWGVCLDLDGGQTPADNFFDLFPGVPHTIRWTSPDLPKVIRVGNRA